ncbi:Outer membrane protein U [Vibrio nigripulchritudo MADA3029]|uniref:porin n=1 Tax=Vibrio nigripulchritudo TaxID=28173 RepID=UPI0003B20EE1|nr:porin [Vibrio nigripulchritudo]CCN45220.1 Outer membrane protein U [Vibrio nigripulchritudo MADA3020]CCN53979.1 Outer membrane protein U [Vibrio nigripulchritudo MADA3021]CCN57608.1 Outer membrane protein U [Vibrio nigripulchritudo MADA3029]
MNKKLIALAVAAAASTTGATAAEIAKNDNASLEMGGRVEARLSLKDNKVEDKSRVRLNFLGKTEITDELYGLGFYEGEFKAYNQSGKADGSNKEANADSIEHRYAFAGIGGNFGEVTFGTVKGSLQAVTDFTDIMAYHGNTAAPKVNAADRPDRSVAYAGTFGDFEARANYTFGSATANTSTDKNEKDNNGGYALSGIYNIGETGARVTAAYAAQDESATKSVKEFMLGASYEFDAFYVAGLYTNIDNQEDGANNGSKGDGYELAAAYTMGQAKFTTTYNRLNNKSNAANSDSEVEKDNIAVDATYFFNDNFRSYVSYNFNLLDSDKVGKLGAQNEAVLGLRYDF